MSVFQPRWSRFLWFVWSVFWLVQPVVYLVTKLPMAGPGPDIIAWAVVGPVLTVIAWRRCLGMRLELHEDGSTYFRNVGRDVSLPSGSVGALVLKRYFSRRPVDREIASELPLLFGTYGMKMPALAFELRDGSMSPPVSVTAPVGPKARDALLVDLSRFAGEHNIELRILRPNRGWMFGVFWDIRRGKGVTSQSHGERSE